MFYLLNIWTLTRKSPTRPWTPHTQRSTTYAYHRLLYQFAYAILASIDGHPSGYFFPVTEGDKGRAEVLKNLLKNSGSSTSNTRRNSGKNKDNWEGKDKDKNKDEDSEDSGEDKDKDDDIDLEPSTHDVGFAMSSDEFCNRESVARKSTVRITNRRAGT